MSNSRSTSPSSRLEVGSSRISARDFVSSARAIATICWMATEQSPNWIVSSRSRPSRSSAWRARFADLPPLQPAKNGRLPTEADIFGDRETGDEVDLLINRADAQVLGVPRVAWVDRAVLHQDLPFVFGIHAGQEFDEGGFARRHSRPSTP